MQSRDPYTLHARAEQERLLAELRRIEEERRRLETGSRELTTTQRRLAEGLDELQNERLRLQEERGDLYRTAERQALEFQKQHESLAAERRRLEDERRQLYDHARAYAEAFRDEARARREELARAEKELKERELRLEERLRVLRAEEARIIEVGGSATERSEKANAELYRVAGMTREQAREELRLRLFEDAKEASATEISKLVERVKAEANNRAAGILATAMQRIAREAVSEVPVAVVQLPSDDFKARIIGRDGRNIRTFESVTGVDLELEEAPAAVGISCFDPLRKERARRCLEELVGDGRIQPNRIEETYERVCKRLDRELLQAGDTAVLEFGFSDIDSEIVKVLGSLKLRVSAGQNVLEHLRESAHLARMMAEELQIDPAWATRGALLHDLGKGLGHTYEGTHAAVGAKFARAHGEPEAVCHAIEAHHDEVEPNTVDAVLVQVADHLSGGRPGARVQSSLENYFRRIEELEAVCKRHKGVADAYAFQGGREIRVVVDPYRIDDTGARLLAREIAKDIESEGKFPNNLRITVIRELRAREAVDTQPPR